AHSWILRGKSLAASGRLSEAEAAYREAIKTVPSDFDSCLAYASFLQARRQYRDASERYENCLAIAREKGDLNRESMSLNGLGVPSFELGKAGEARNAYEKALTIRLQLARTSKDYLPDVATTLNNLGNLHRDQNRTEEAQKAYEEALAI